MTNCKLLIFILLITLSMKSQSVNYKIIKDDPDAISEKYITIDVLGSDSGFDFKDGGIFIGANGFWKLTEKIKAEAVLRLNVYNMAGSGLGMHTEAGVFYSLKTKYTKTEVPVLFSSTTASGKDLGKKGIDYGKTYDVTKTFNVKGTFKSEYGTRGGLYQKTSPFTIEDNSNGDKETNYNLFGAYLGLQKIKQAFVETDVNRDAYYGQARTRMYIDLLLLPVKSIGEPSFDASKEAGLGYRAGFQWQKTPMGPHKWIRPVYTVEIGNRPFSGWYLMGSLGITPFNF